MDLAIAAHGHPAHVLSTTSYNDIRRTSGNHARGNMHGNFTGAALAVNGEPWNGHWPARPQQRGAGNVGRLLSDLSHTPEDHIVDMRGREIDTL
ncbi:hypothetical protein D3C81_1367770 [compost metagenome]